ncbi:hypothetical protein C8J37_11645 [Rhizobium sp. PP-WC-1G-195]|nr:hypothetical protein C8J37_11645 [Rhizobium sp. PP-WC-1G-195]
MLRPPLRIFLAHRDGSPEFQHAVAAIEHCRKVGFRVEAAFINKASLPFSTSIPVHVYRELDRSQAALVLLSPDKRISRFWKKLPALAVVFEWGYLSSVIAGNRLDGIQVLRTRGVQTGKINSEVNTVEMPSDLSEFAGWLEKYLREKHSMVASGNLFGRKRSRLTIASGDLGEPSMSDAELMRFFADEIASISDDGERILYIYERVFFDVYFEDKQFWREQIASLSDTHPSGIYHMLLTALDSILYYTSGPWRDKKDANLTIADRTEIYVKYKKLQQAKAELDLGRIDCIFSIVIHNYLGLFESRAKIGEMLGPARVGNAFTNFMAAAAIARNFESGEVKLWQGFISANIATMLYENPDSIDDHQIELNSALEVAANMRRAWLNPDINLPYFLRDIFRTEYFLSLSKLSKQYDGDGGQFSEVFGEEFGTWEKSAQASRFVRVKKLFEEKDKVPAHLKIESDSQSQPVR